MKALAAAAIVLIAVLLVLWKQLDASDASVAVKPEPPTVTSQDVVASPPPPVQSEASAKAAAAAAQIAAAAEPEKAATGEKLDPMSDEFFYKFQELVPKKTTANAAKCYEGISKRVHRNQKMSFRYKVVIKDGNVSIKDIAIKENTLNNPGLETCFMQEVARTVWVDPELPDGEWDDELVLRPERGMKKYMRDNIEYVGAEAPKD